MIPRQEKQLTLSDAAIRIMKKRKVYNKPWCLQNLS